MTRYLNTQWQAELDGATRSGRISCSGPNDMRGPNIWHDVARPIDNDECSKCGGELDTGYECIDCGYDAQPELDQ